ncbi:MAG: BREX-1 system adenine-specific DNA-methyltransferase PglX [Propionibacterium sp.]|jgi:SAM-dependent methyltransferase|nr:BREX-1 system adenine-specific DNA-methyltransferase PglX [Propionibacterium sp.]
METAPLKSFATWARTSLIREVTARIAVVLAPASPERVEQSKAVEALEKAVTAAGGVDKGKAAVADKVAYTWFNRIIALRFMDANGYTGVGVVSPQAGVETGQPEVLAEAKRGNIDTGVVAGKTRETVTSLLNGTRRSTDAQGEAYALLLADYCRHWNRAMPFMFEREGDFTEMLIPANLLAEDSVPSRAVKVLTKDVCQDVEVIGWLYQFYISERKDEVFAGFKKNKKAGADEIPAATQLFTPHWIVRYLVENSLGRLWMLNRPDSRLVDQMEYYIAPVNDETDFLKITRPEELKVVDPACGSGHMLTYAFDLLYAIYEEEGYAPAEIPGLVLTNNLFGVEIDPRAGALAAFALTMKARAKQRTFFNKQIEPNVCVLDPIRFTPDEIDFLLTRVGNKYAESAFWNQFDHADVYGSLTRPDPESLARLSLHLDSLDDGGNMLRADVIDRARQVVRQAEYLSPRYSAAVANPPYMGSGNMGALLTDFAKHSFPVSKADLFAMFIERSIALCLGGGFVGMITMQSWLFLGAFQKLRVMLLRRDGIENLAHLGTGAFDTIGGEVVATAAFIVRVRRPGGVSLVERLVNATGSQAKESALREVAQGRNLGLATRVDLRSMLAVPRSPLAYWFSPEVIGLFKRGRTVATVAETAKGMVTADNAAFVRQWWEVSLGRIGFGYATREKAEASGMRWFPYARGGGYRKWFGNIDAVVDWLDDGRAIQTTMTSDGSRVRATNTNLSRIFKRGVTWSSVTTGRPSFRLVDDGHLFDAAGGICQSRYDLYLMALLNSRAAEEVLYGLNPTINLPPDYLGSMPLPANGPSNELDQAVSRCVQIQRSEWASAETAWEFTGLDFAPRSVSLSTALEDRRSAYENRQEELVRLESGFDTYFDASFGISNAPAPPTSNPWRKDSHSVQEDVKALLSFAVGCMFGRYSLDDSGLILADQGATVEHYLAKVPSPTFAPDKDNVIPIVDGDWFEDDIVARVRTFLRVAFGEQHFEQNLQFVTDALGVKDIREYFIKTGARAASSRFYDDHTQRYRKRPIYWLFSSPRGSFSALMYMHRYTPSTVSTVLNEYLREFTAKLSSSLQQQERLAAGGGTPRQQAAAQKEADRLRKVLLELEEYEHDVLYPLASRQLTIDLDDGVKANYPKFGTALKKIPGLEASDE